MKMYTKESLDKLQKEIDLETVCEAFDIDMVSRLNVYRCPFCEEETFVLSDFEEEYYCFSCKAKGDAISLIMIVKEQSFDSAVNFLSILFDSKLEECEKTAVPRKNSPMYLAGLLTDIIKNERLSDEETLNYVKALDIIKNNGEK